ncbi:MAG: DUF58 domain-containing protein [Myxococcota bacterium]|nr:DUF58 domain-containing protein [Myxococcota bacterium]
MTSDKQSPKTLGLDWLRLKRWMFPRGLTITREGKVYLGITLGVGFAAINTGNNLLFLVLGLLLGLIVVSGIISEITLRSMTIKRHIPRYIEADAPFAVELSLKNDKRYAASFGVELRDEIDGKPFRRRCFFLRVGPGEERKVTYRCVLGKRGRAEFQGTIVSTRFPFGLFEKRRFIALTDDIIVLPSRISISMSHPFSKEDWGTHSAVVPGPGDEFRELRQMGHGDDPRRIHWRATARLGKTYIRETFKDARGFVELVLDAAPVSDAAAAMADVEQRIRAAGTLVQDLTGQGIAVRLVTTGECALTARDHREAISLLVHLALIDPIEAGRAPAPVGTSPVAITIGQRAKSRGRAHQISIPKQGDMTDTNEKRPNETPL